ncbi:2OG-Fe(II) oxygenase [Hyphobacterium sp.]|uniref:2OG-Fe(II) oxygenase n=1 Tax=Hyphobacterium sp. TaxID=2004662 RepID=UPI003748738E
MSDELIKSADAAFARGDAAAARQLLRQAADAGDVNAAYAYAMALAYGQGGPIDHAGAADLISQIHRSSPAASKLHRVALASGWAAGTGWGEAAAALVADARAGQPAEIREAGLLCLIAGDLSAGRTLLSMAASEGDPPAGMALMRMGFADRAAHSWAAATAEGLQRSKHPLADELLATSQRPLPSSNGIDWKNLEHLLSADFSSVPAAANTLVEAIHAQQYTEALPPPVCDYILTTGLRALRSSMVVDPDTGQQTADPHRQSLSMTFAPNLQDLVHAAAEHRMAAMAGLPPENTERLNLLFYRPGEHYKPHVDYFAPDDPGNARELKRAGQRAATSLVCLHAAREGGATRFPRFDTAWTGSIGEGLSFRNTDDDGNPNPLTLHQGEPVISGWKALASLWIRTRKAD